jgi:hypothetical protein
MALENLLNQQSTASSTGTNYFDALLKTGSDIYTANRETRAAKETAKATTANAQASVLSSRNMIIAGVVVAVAIVAVLFFRK